MTEAFYQYPFLVSDTIRYRACAIAVAIVENLADLGPELIYIRAHRYPRTAERLKSRMQDLPSDATLNERFECGFELLKDWRSLFSPTDQCYRSLNRTLMNLPGGVPVNVVAKLQRVMLERPLTDRLELMTVGLFAERHNQSNMPVIMRSNRDEIQTAIQEVSNYIGMELSHRKTVDVNIMVRLISDYPERHVGRLPGLARKAVRWHRELSREEAMKKGMELGLETRAAIPPIGLPDIEGVRFLATVGDIVAEADQMQHCVVSYAEQAINGQLYLFHVSHGNQDATASILVDGRLEQVCGPSNRHNDACDYGRSVLSKWAESLCVPRS